MKSDTQIAVIGGGHAGIEAALAASRMGCDTVLFSLSLDAIGNLPCNPSVGGVGKGHLVYEIDALGGEMGALADAATISSRTLNTSGGASVHSKRVQVDRAAYAVAARAAVTGAPNLRVVQAEAAALLLDGNGAVSGLTMTDGTQWSVCAVIIAAGTYLRSQIVRGEEVRNEGPDGFCAATATLST